MRELSLEDKELLSRAYSKVESANSILQFLGEHFQKKYGLQFGEQITPNGEIVSQSTNGIEPTLSTSDHVSTN